MKYQITEVDGVITYASAFVNGELYTATAGHHPNFASIVEALRNGDENRAVGLFDVEQTVKIKFEQLTERVQVRDGQIYFDGDLMHNALAKQIMAFLDAGVEDYKPLVNFFEKVMQNPSENSRNECFDWLTARAFTITPDGDFVAYKGVFKRDEPDVFYSSRPAPERERVTVNGELIVNDYVPNRDGAVVEMPRSLVDDDLNRHCSNGLHVGTFEYANSFGGGNVLEVHVNPRDVVSVTADSSRQKIRVCRYKVVKAIEAPYTSPVTADYYGDAEFEDEDDEDNAFDYAFEVGDKVVFVDDDPTAQDSCGVGEVVAVDRLDDTYKVLFDDGCSEWLDESELEEYVVPVVVQDVTKATAVDTRQNYLSQQRYPKGHPKAGQFIPKV